MIALPDRRSMVDVHGGGSVGTADSRGLSTPLTTTEIVDTLH
jgi:hypothetical protein